MERFGNFYDRMMAPIEKAQIGIKRKKLMSQVSGEILEIGAGTGANFKYYDFQKIQRLAILDLELTEKVKNYTFPKSLKLSLFEGSAEALPFDSNTFDRVIFTLVLCSVNDPMKALLEVHRVLKPGGKIVFMEHILPNGPILKGIFNHLNPAWKKIAHGCHLNRETLITIEKAGFKIDYHEKFYKGTFVEGIGTKWE